MSVLDNFLLFDAFSFLNKWKITFWSYYCCIFLSIAFYIFYLIICSYLYFIPRLLIHCGMRPFWRLFLLYFYFFYYCSCLHLSITYFLFNYYSLLRANYYCFFLAQVQSSSFFLKSSFLISVSSTTILFISFIYLPLRSSLSSSYFLILFILSCHWISI